MPQSPSPICRPRQRGVAAVEFALCSIVFLIAILGMFEMARVMYLWNTLTDTTRRIARAAAITNPAQSAAILQAALFNADGTLPMSVNITSASVTVRYLNNDLGPVDPMPCPAQNQINCSVNSNATDCVRFVEARLCTGIACEPLPYAPLFLPAGLLPWQLNFPTFATVRPAGSLGFRPGEADSCS
ncbi:MAG: TadE/TadG family type IV pilus assembly protein [Pseudomonadota bacterium]